MKYKVGDRVRIKNLDWYNRHTNGTEIDCGGVPFTSGMKWFCSCVMTISFVHADCYAMVEDLENYYTDEMIEGLVEEETLIERVDDNGLPFNEWLSHKGAFHVPNGYELKDENGNVINTTKIVLEKKKKEYPKTYEECCKVLNIAVRDLDILDNMLDTSEIIYRKNLDRLLNSFRKLLICRDAYWKIAGEEMGLGKPWEPDWTDEHQVKYTIYTMGNDVIRHVCHYIHAVLSFPTEEMRDAFKENFDPDIEFCKELL